MPTNAIGSGTANVPVNFLEDEKTILGRLAMDDDRSLGDFIRRQVITGLRVTNPQAARELENVRFAHYERQAAERQSAGAVTTANNKKARRK